MKKLLLTAIVLLAAVSGRADTTLPLEGTIVTPDCPLIQYVGRICFDNPLRPRFTFPGTTVNARFTGTSLRMVAKPQSGYFMVTIDGSAPFKVALTGERDSVVTLATALPDGQHRVSIMYAIEGYDLKPDFRGFVLDSGASLLPPIPLPERRIEFVGNSITCGYGIESTVATDHFSYQTENHYYTYAQQTARELGAVAHVVARSGIGVYRSYGGPKTGTPDNVMTTEYEYTNLYDRSERWDFSRFRPQVVCINLGTNDMSTNNYDVARLKAAYKQLLQQVRSHNPEAAIVFLCGPMLGGKELAVCRETLDAVVGEANKQGDKNVYRFNFTPANGSLKFGADYHPSLWQHRQMASELTSFLRPLMQWF